MTVPIPRFTHTAQFFVFTDSLCYSPQKIPQKIQKNLNLKKIHFDTSCLIFISYTAPISFCPKISKNHKKNVISKKFTSIVHACHLLSAIQALPTLEKLTGLVPRTTNSKTTLIYQALILPLLWYLVRKLSLCTYLLLLLVLHIVNRDKTFKIITPASRYINHLRMRASLLQLTGAYLAINFSSQQLCIPFLSCHYFPTQGHSR